jgi:hypothetical protein
MRKVKLLFLPLPLFSPLQLLQLEKQRFFPSKFACSCCIGYGFNDMQSDAFLLFSALLGLLLPVSTRVS